MQLVKAILVAKIQHDADDQTGQDDEEDDGQEILDQLANLGSFGGAEFRIFTPRRSSIKRHEHSITTGEAECSQK